MRLIFQHLTQLMTALDNSLEEAAYCYIDYLLNHDIQVVHPWLWKAYLKLHSHVRNG